MQVNKYINMSNSGVIIDGVGTLAGMYVNNTNAGTVKFYDTNLVAGTGTGTVVSGLITPGIGYHNLGNIAVYTGVIAEFGGTALDVTFHVAKNF